MQELRCRRVMSAPETRERRDPSRPRPLGARSGAGAPDQPNCLTFAELVTLALSDSPVIAHPANHDRERNRDPSRECEREHEDRDAEDERVHFSVVVASRHSIVPRPRDPVVIATMRTDADERT